VPKVIGIIPSRYASKRFPGKPLALISGVPVIVRVFKQALKCNILDDLIIATDDHRIADVVTENGGKVVMADGKFKCGTERVASVAKNHKTDIVVNIQGDDLLISPDIINKVVNCLIDNPKALMSTACSRIKDPADIDDPNTVKVVMAKDGKALYFSRSRMPWFKGENSSTAFDEIKAFHHIGIYGFKADFLQKFASLEQSMLEKTESLEQLRALENGYDIYCVKTSLSFVDINSQSDLFKAEKMLEGLR